jgi:hypothetical protein
MRNDQELAHENNKACEYAQNQASAIFGVIWTGADLRRSTG